jgi:hypothetical protein
MIPDLPFSSGTVTVCGWGAAANATALYFRPPRRDDDKGNQFPDAPTGVREPRPTKPRSPAGAIALPLP